MRHGDNVLTTALRVLTAVVDRKTSDPADVRELQRISPNTLYVSLDEMACDVIQKILRERKEIRTDSAAAD